MTSLAVYFLGAFTASVLLTPLCRLIARRLGLVAKPRRDRWHDKPTALFGGVAIAVPVLGIGATIRPLDDIGLLLACGGAIAFFGLLDDFFSLKPTAKLVTQITIASALLFFGYSLKWTGSPAMDAMLTVFWIVGITNAFNLLDNMDGLCAGIAAIASLTLLAGLLFSNGVDAHALYVAALAGACLGFLVYNFNPASIFMGDAGSLFLGLNLAMLTLIMPAGGSGISGLLSIIAVPALLMLVPIFDTTLVTLARLLAGRRPSQGGRDHASHRLVAIGLSQRGAVATLWGLAAAAGGIGLSFRMYDSSTAVLLTALYVIAMVIFGVYLGRIRVYEEEPAARTRQQITPLVADFMYKRRVAEVLLDLCLVPLAYYAAYRLRFEGIMFDENLVYFIQSLPVVLACQLVALYFCGAYQTTWRHFGLMDAVGFARGVVLGTVAAELVLLYAYRFHAYSRAVFLIYAGVLLFMLVASRGSFRLMGEFARRTQSGGRRFVVYGIGPASLATIRDAFGPNESLRMIGFIDDDPQQRRIRVGGYAVIGGLETLLALIETNAVDCVVLNAPLIAVDRLRMLEAACQARGVLLLRLNVNLKPVSAVS
jgi:UDP-GlcNAc:undecaprenyl-phosphate/decaprenyl-phosphate GlcNAc-1-phosphate transferase